MATIGTMLICRDQLLRLGLQSVFASRQHIRLLGAADGAEMEEQLAREQPQIIIVDSDSETDLPGLIHRIKALVPGGKIVLLTSFETKCTGKALSSGIDGLLLKVQPPAALMAYIESLSGLADPDPSQPKSIAKETQMVLETSSRHVRPQSGSLTDREREIVALIGQGLSNKDIADRLCISVITVRHHLTSIFDKLGVATRQKLLIRAYQYGLVELSIPA